MRQYDLIQLEDNRWAVTEIIGNASRIVYTDEVFEFAECMKEEFEYFANAEAEYDSFHNQQCEFDVYGDNVTEYDYV